MNINFFKFATDEEHGGYYFNDKSSPDKSSIVLISAPWSVTSDYGHGAAYAPDSILDYSTKVGLYDGYAALSLSGKVATTEVDYEILELCEQLGSDAERVREHVEDGGSLTGEFFARKLARVNEGIEHMVQSISLQTSTWSTKGKIVGIVGGDRSVSYGAIRALAEQHKGMGVLMLDAHCNMKGKRRIFSLSHDSITRNILDNISDIERLVIAGVRDIDDSELSYASRNGRLVLLPQSELAAEQFRGKSWATICNHIVAKLPQKVFISLDIDVLDAPLCPNTLRPVAGGMTFDQAAFLLMTVAESGRDIVGFDLTGVVPKIDSTIDTNTGTRLLAKLCIAALKSRINR